MRLPIATNLASRDGTTAKDGGCRNAVIEIVGKISALLKRPGVSDGGNVGTGISQLLACYNGELKAIIGNTLSNLIVVEKTSGSLFEYPTPSTGGWAGVTYGAGKFVAISNTGIPATSADGVNWTVHAAINTGALPASQWQDVAFGNGVFVALYDAFSGNVFTSTDGISWSSTGISIINDVLTFGESPHLKFVNGNFFVLSDSHSGMGEIAVVADPTVTDPGDWSAAPVNPSFGSSVLYDIDDVEYFSGKYYILAHRQSDNHKLVGSSTNAITWSEFVAAVPNSRDAGMYERLGVIGGKLVVAGVSYSSNGTTWTESVGLPDGYWVYPNSTLGVIDGKAHLLIHPDAGGFPQVLMTSTDGIVWNIGPSPTNNNQHYGSASNGTCIVSLGAGSNDSVVVYASGAPVGISATVDSSVAITAIEPSIRFFSEVSGQAQSQNVIVLRNAKEAWTYDGSTLSKITDADYPGWSTVTPTGITRSGAVATVTLPAAVNWQSGSSVTIAGAVETEYNGTHVISVTDSTHFTYPVTGTPATPATGTITATGGRTTVPGIVYLDGYFFVMDQNAVIYNCALGDPTSWNALDFLTANIEPGSGVAIAKVQNYIIALKSWSTEFFYDAGNAVGSPLSPVMNAFTLIGCASGDSVANIDGTVAWVSKTRQKGRAVHIMAGLEQQKVSTPDIERILNADSLTNVYSYGVKISGHTFYVLGLKDSGITLVYDFTSQTWAQWTSLTAQASKSCTITSADGIATVTCNAHGYADGDPVTIAGAAQTEYNGTQQIRYIDANTFKYAVSGNPSSPATGTISAVGYTETYFKYTKYVYCSGRDLVLHETTGELCEITETVFQDSGKPINFLARTGKIDGDSIERKTNSQLKVIGNKIGGIAMVRWSDDDYTTNSAYRPIDLSSEQARLSRLGSFRRRSYELRHVGNSPVQVAALELDISQEK